MKKNVLTYGLIAAGVVAAIILIRKQRKKSSVYAGSPIKQTQQEFEAEYAEVVKEKPSILETAGTLIRTIFPKKTMAEKAQKKSVKAQKKQVRKQKVLAGIEDVDCLY